METVGRLEQQDAIERVPSVVLSKVVGLVIVTVVPAAFWTGVLVVIGSVFGVAFSAGTLWVIGAGLAVLLSLVFAALTLSSEGAGRERS